jgi:hypothetical protein
MHHDSIGLEPASPARLTVFDEAYARQVRY